MTLPILYSLRNCPFAMRARLAIFKSGLSVELRDVNLKNKPNEMLQASPKGTVPTLVLPSETSSSDSLAPNLLPSSNVTVIDESFDVMLWALNESDPDGLLRTHELEKQTEMLALIQLFDNEFKGCLENYKCAKRYHETNVIACREACEVYIQQLEQRLSAHDYLMDENESLADIALLPFIRQFARVERPWYLQSSYINVQRWLKNYLQSPLFTKVMAKYPTWEQGGEQTIFTRY